MRLAASVRKEGAHVARDAAGLLAALLAPFLVVWIFSTLDLPPPTPPTTASPVALILCLSIWLSSLTAAATSLYRERTAGTLQRLAATPFSPGMLVGTKAAVLAAIGVAQALIVWGSARLLLADGVAGADDLGAILALLLLAFETVALGMLLAALLRSPAQIANVVTLLTLAVLTLCGFLKPVDHLGVLEPVARFLPFTLAYDAVREVVAGHALPLEAFALMAVEGVLFLAASTLVVRATRQSSRSG
jgi:ABC-type multidrug transport system permease subunit